MADAKTRKQRLWQRRQQASLKVHLVWLSPAGQAAMAALRQPGETVDAFLVVAANLWKKTRRFSLSE